jgi:hypothetical protein
MGDIKIALSKLCGITVGNIVLADVSDGRLYEIYHNNKSLLALLEERDDEERGTLLHAYEIGAPNHDCVNESSGTILAFLSHTKTLMELPKQFQNRYIGFSFMVSFDLCGLLVRITSLLMQLILLAASLNFLSPSPIIIFNSPL